MGRRRKKEKKPARIIRLAHRLGWHPGRVMSEVLEWVEVLVVAGILALLVMRFVTVRMHVPTGSMIPAIDPRDSFFVDRISYLFRDPEPGDIVVFWHTDSVSIRSVEPDSPAERAGLNRGARILTLNRETVTSAARADEILREIPDGTTLYLGISGASPAPLGEKTAAVQSLTDLGLTLREHRIRYVKRLIAVGGQTVQIVDGRVLVDGEPLTGERFDRTYTIDPSRMRYAVAPTRVPERHWFVLGDNTRDSWDSRYWGFVDVDDFIGEPFLRVWPVSRFGLMNGYFGSSP